MRVIAHRIKEFNGIVKIYDKDMYEKLYDIFENEKIAELEVDTNDTIYVVQRSGGVRNTDIPDFLEDNRIVNTTTEWNVAVDSAETILREFENKKGENKDNIVDKGISIDAYRFDGEKFIEGCSLRVALFNKQTAYITFEGDIADYTEIINYYNEIRQRGKR